MGNIVTLSQYQGGGWPVDEFFHHGQIEIDQMLDHIDALGLRGKCRDLALDFGCGVGRLTQALGLEYDHVIGADISAEMVKQAKELNRRGDRVEYVKTGERLLDTLEPGTFDLIYSRIVLQHMPAEYQRAYVGEFVKLLAPNGLAVFQIPEGPDARHYQDWLSMYAVPRPTVEEWIDGAGGKLLDVEALDDGSNGTWQAWRYTVTP